jgi:hypothetical protein
MARSETCPFKVGDVVIYRPSARGVGLEVMAPPESKLTPGQRYVISEIHDENYIVVEGYKHPGGGLYWAEFEPAP